MMHTLKIEARLFSLKGFFWLCLFELLHSNSGSLSQELTVVVQAGDEARLPCRYQIASGTLKSYYIYWQKVNLDKQDLVVISYKYGEEVELEKDKTYKNRSKLEEQNLILSIASVTVNDSGLYQCIAILESHVKGKTFTRLSVIVPFSTPIILNNLSGEHCDSKILTLMCLSHGGSSEPKMYGSINENPVNWTVTSNEIFGHFNIAGTLQLNMTENILIQCSVHYLDFQVSSNYSLNMAKNCSEPTMPPLIPPFGIIISSGVILIFFLAMVMLVILQCYFHKRPTSSTTHQSLATDEMILKEHSRRQTRSRLQRSSL